MGPWTNQKLKALEEYIRMYTTALRNRGFDLVYIDAFAGTGSRPSSESPLLDEDVEIAQFAKGSAAIALENPIPFKRYYFVEKDRVRFEELKRFVAQFIDAGRHVRLVKGDANETLRKILVEEKWHVPRRQSRAIAFVDPYACQVEFETIKEIARSRAVDLWILFPVMAVNRNLQRQGNITEEAQRRLDILFGTLNWREEFYVASRQVDLWTVSGVEKVATTDDVERFYGDRLRTVFDGRVCPQALRLFNSRKGHLFSLFFACSNPSPAAHALSMKFASHAIQAANSRIGS